MDNLKFNKYAEHKKIKNQDLCKFYTSHITQTLNMWYSLKQSEEVKTCMEVKTCPEQSDLCKCRVLLLKMKVKQVAEVLFLQPANQNAGYRGGFSLVAYTG